MPTEMWQVLGILKED